MMGSGNSACSVMCSARHFSSKVLVPTGSLMKIAMKATPSADPALDCY